MPKVPFNVTLQTERDCLLEDAAWRRNWGWIGLGLIACLSMFFSERMMAGTPGVQTIESSWSYHWGDLPREKSWRWDQVSWQGVDELSDLNKPTNENILWLRLELPAGHWRDPYLYFTSVDLTVQVFENDRLTYAFGEIDEAGNSHFAGWPWHLIPVSTSKQPTTLYFRIFSDYPFIGPAGELLIGERADLLDRVYQRGMTGLAFVLAIFIVGVISMGLGLIKRDRGRALSVGVLSFDLVLMIFAENELSQVIWFEPLIWRYIAAYCYFLIPVFLGWVVYEWFGRRGRMVPSIMAVSAVFPIGVAFLSMVMPSFSFINAYPVFDVLFVLLVAALLVYASQRIHTSQPLLVLVALGILAVFVSLVLDMFSAHGLIDWIGRAGQWGLLFFTASMLAIYLLKDWKQQITLRVLTSTLEKQVVDRTRELTESHKKLELAARTDFLTGLLNRRAFMEMAGKEVANAVRHDRPLSLVLFDIDHFKDINDEYGHDIGDQVLVALSHAAQKECREGDLICRYGGEEFVILLHSTTPADARALVARIRQVISGVRVIAHDGRVIQITASFGLISYSLGSEEARMHAVNPDKLLQFMLVQADHAMYDVKNAGRDGIKEYSLSGQFRT